MESDDLINVSFRCASHRNDTFLFSLKDVYEHW